MATQRVDAKTPNGGEYSIAYYQDKNGNDTPIEKAKVIIINEYDKNNNVLNSNYCVTSNHETALEARAPAGFSHGKPFVIGGQQFVGGQFIPNTSQADVDKAAAAQGTGPTNPQQPAAEPEQKDRQPAQFNLSSSDLNSLMKYGKRTAIYQEMDGEEKSLFDKLAELTKIKKHAILFPVGKLSNIDQEGEVGEFEPDNMPPCIVDEQKTEDDKHDLIVGNDIALYAEKYGDRRDRTYGAIVPAIIANEDDKSVEALLQDKWAKWMYSRIDDSDTQKLEKRKKVIESLSWLDFIATE